MLPVLFVAIAAAVEPRPLEAYEVPDATTWGFDVSPDGQSLAYVHRTPVGRHEVLVAPKADPTATRAIFDTDEYVHAFWDLGNRFLMLQTYGETAGILSLDVESGELRRLTDGIGAGLRHAIGDGRFAAPLQARTWRKEAASVTAATSGSEEIVVHAGAEWYESRVVALDPTREVPSEILWRGKWWTNRFQFLLDDELRPAFAWEWRMRSGFEGIADEAQVPYRVDFWAMKENGKHKWTGKEARSVESPQWTLVSDRVIDGGVVEIDDHDHDTAAVWSREVATGDLELLWSDPRADVTRAVLDEDGGLAAVAIDRARREWTALDPALVDDFTFLSANLPGEDLVVQWSGAMTIENSAFVGSRLSTQYYGTSSSDMGLAVRDSSFEGSTRWGSTGGALFAHITSGTALVQSSEFLDNQVDGSGGAIYLELADANVTLSGTTFERNRGGHSGGALEVHALDGSSALTIVESSFDSNQSSNDAGAMRAEVSNGATLAVSVQSSNFEGNFDVSSAGAVLAEVSDASSLLDLEIRDSVFRGNSSDDGAGALHVIAHPPTTGASPAAHLEIRRRCSTRTSRVTCGTLHSLRRTSSWMRMAAWSRSRTPICWTVPP